PHFTHSLPTRRSSDLSLNCIESISNLPMPGNENTVSTTIEPPNKKPNCNPAIVITVTSDFFKACPNITAFSLNTLDLAVLTKSSCSVCTKDERVKQVIIAIIPAPHAMEGKIYPFHVSIPPAGKILKTAANNCIITKPSQKFGTEIPEIAVTVPK